MKTEHVNNVREAVLTAASFLKKHGISSSRLEAELILSKVLLCDRAFLYAHLKDNLTREELESFKELIEKRAKGVPLQYITGEKDFMSMKFQTKPGVLIPRSDTELLVETLIKRKENFSNILEVGTGSGIIAVALAKYFPDSRITAVDISPKALDLACSNARYHAVENRISFVNADISRWLPNERYDLVVSNPPYIPTSDFKNLQKEVLSEPRSALDGGFYGLRFYPILVFLAGKILLNRGVLALEIGCNQSKHVKKIIEESESFHNINIISDYAGRERVILCGKK